MNAWTRKLPSGRWQGQYRVGGRVRSVGTFPRKADAHAAAIEEARRIGRGDWVDPKLGRTTFRTFADDRMEMRRRSLRPGGTDRDDRHYRNHIIPVFGSMPLIQINRSDVERWVGDLCDRKKLAPRTVRNIHSIFSSLLSEAVDAGYLRANPCTRKSRTRRTSYLPRVPEGERRFLSRDELYALADAFDPRYRAFVILGGYLGPRWGELAGLKRQHANLLKRELRLVGSLERFGNSFRYVEETKTVNGRRTLPISPLIADVLTPHVGNPDSEFLFPTPKGGPMDYQNFMDRFWRPAVVRADIEHVTPHGLRHTAAALMIDQGAHAVTVQRILGHKDIRTTLQLYGHLFPHQLDDLCDRMDALFAGESAAHMLHDGPA